MVRKKISSPLLETANSTLMKLTDYCSIGRSSEPCQGRAIISADLEKLEMREENNKIRSILGKTI